MAKLLDTAIGATDIRDFADGSSDFGFELRVLSQLISLNIACEHGGTYDDPVTNKPRQFDIRATLDLMRTTIGRRRIRMAIECKNLKENFPLAVFMVPRVSSESYHEVIFSHEPQQQSNGLAFESHGTSMRLNGAFSFYAIGQPVGKSCSQVGRTTTGNELTGSDTEVYDKWSQAIHSAHDLIDRANEDWHGDGNRTCATFVLPVLVVPNQRLWAINYLANGTRIGSPTQIDRACFYIDKYVASTDRLTGISASLSVTVHLRNKHFRTKE